MPQVPIGSVDLNAETRIAVHEARLLKKHGTTFIGGAELRTVLGFKTGAAFRQAVHTGRVPVRTFIQAGRRGRFARIHDLAVWLARIDAQIDAQNDRAFEANSAKEAASEIAEPVAHK
jgi:hypothetical protein